MVQIRVVTMGFNIVHNIAVLQRRNARQIKTMYLGIKDGMIKSLIVKFLNTILLSKTAVFSRQNFLIANLPQMELFRSTSAIYLVQTLAQQTFTVKSILTALIFNLLILVIIVTWTAMTKMQKLHFTMCVMLTMIFLTVIPLKLSLD